MTVSSAKLLCHVRLSADDPQRISADFAAIYTYAADFAAIYIPNLTAIAFIFARHYLRPSAALTLQR